MRAHTFTAGKDLKLKAYLAFTATAVMLGASPSIAANLIHDGGFETPIPPAGHNGGAFEYLG